MKKSLLVLAMAVGSFMSADAQATYFQQIAKPFKGSRVVMAPRAANLFTGALAKKNAPKKAEAEAYAIYDFPAGTLYDGVYDGGWYSSKNVMLPGMVPQTFYNYSSNRRNGATYIWQISNGKTLSGENFTDSTAVNGEAQAWGYTYAPTLTQNSADGTTQTYTAQNSKKTSNAVIQWGADSTVFNLSNTCPSDGVYGRFTDGGSFTSNQEFQNLKDGAWNNTGKKLTGFMQLYEPLSSEVYTDGVYALVSCDAASDDPAKLFAGADTLQAKLALVGDKGLEAPFAVAKATVNDVAAYGEGSNLFLIKYKFYDVDPILGVAESPLTLPVGKTFAVLLPGFEKLTNQVSALFGGADGFTGHGYAILEDNSISTIGYSNDAQTPQVNLHIGFTDCAEAVGYAPVDTVYFDANGSDLQCLMDGKMYNDAIAYTALTDWEVSSDEWITPTVSEDYVASQGLVDITARAEAMPKDVKGRMGKITLSRSDLGKTITFVCIQGDKQAATGIEGIKTNKVVKSNGAIYNLAGQRVSKDYKGLVIKNGKKFFNK